MTKPQLIIAFFVSITIVLLACKKDAETAPGPAPVDPVGVVLNLPFTPFNYANPTMPGYLPPLPYWAM
jgi:hypothetical protein